MGSSAEDSFDRQTNRTISLTRTVLNGKGSWPFWKADVLLAAKAQKLTGFLLGQAERPSQPAVPKGDGDDETYKVALYKHLNEVEAFESREGALHVALNHAMDRHHRALTMHCETPATVWNDLCELYESKDASDVMDLLDEFEGIKLSDAKKIPEFIDDVKRVQTALLSVEKGFTDEELALRILRKLPSSMKELRMTLRYGPNDQLKLNNLVKTLKRYHQELKHDDEQTKQEVAAMARDRKKKVDKSKSRCFNCNETGHWRSDCKKPKKSKKQEDGAEKDQKEKVAGNEKEDQAHVALCAIAGAFGSNPDAWILDTGATTSMSPSIQPDREEHRQIVIGNGESVTSRGSKSAVDIGGMRLKNVLAVPDFKANLMSIGGACDDGTIEEAVFDKDGCTLWKDGKVIARGERRGRLYVIETNEWDAALTTIDRWHERLCHTSKQTINRIVETGAATGLEISGEGATDEEARPCKICSMTMQTSSPFPRQSETRDLATGRTLHTDLIGPMEVDSLQGCRYAMPVTDDHSRMCRVYFLRKKSDAIASLMDAISHSRSETGNRVAYVRADNGGEFTSTDAKRQLDTLGIKLLTSVPYCPQQNGVGRTKEPHPD
jgi:hypothetical protein